MFTSTLLRFLILQTFVALALCCFCMHRPQYQHFCSSDYVLKVKVFQKMKITSDDRFWEKTGPVKILKVFKGHVPDLDLIGDQVVKLSMHAYCMTYLEVGKEYLVFGILSGSTINIGGCGENKLWSDLTPDELLHLENRYSKYCTAQSYRNKL